VILTKVISFPTHTTLPAAAWQRFSAPALNLTKSGGCDSLGSLQPKSGFLPEADAGDPNSSRQLEDGANGARQRAPRPLSRPSPTANLAGNWKGDFLKALLQCFIFTQNKTQMPG
jgi:hypothetical protein